MARMNPYLYFNGNCEEAFNFYEGVFGKKVSYIGRYKDVSKQDKVEKSMANSMLGHLVSNPKLKQTELGSLM